MKKKDIIPASRKTDTPAFYSDWFIRRLNEGYLYVKNPYSGKVYHLSPKSQDLHSTDKSWLKKSRKDFFSTLLENGYLEPSIAN